MDKMHRKEETIPESDGESHPMSRYEQTNLLDPMTEMGLAFKPRSGGWPSRATSFLLKLFVLALAGWGFISIAKYFWSPGAFPMASSKSAASVDPHVCDCGASVDEAVSSGCSFVPMAAAWLPPACIDQELSDEFNAAGPGDDGSWSYWKDADLEHEITVHDVSMLADSGGLFYTTWEWHVKHCTFYWRLDYRRRWLNTILEPRYDHESHVTHCQMIMFADRTKATGSDVKLNSTSGRGVSHEHSHHHETETE